MLSQSSKQKIPVTVEDGILMLPISSGPGAPMSILGSMLVPSDAVPTRR